jgi:hypothetical protein
MALKRLNSLIKYFELWNNPQTYINKEEVKIVCKVGFSRLKSAQTSAPKTVLVLKFSAQMSV